MTRDLLVFYGMFELWHRAMQISNGKNLIGFDTELNHFLLWRIAPHSFAISGKVRSKGQKLKVTPKQIWSEMESVEFLL